MLSARQFKLKMVILLYVHFPLMSFNQNDTSINGLYSTFEFYIKLCNNMACSKEKMPKLVVPRNVMMRNKQISPLFANTLRQYMSE